MRRTKPEETWTIFQRGDGAWCARYKDESGKWRDKRVPRVAVTAKRHAEARRQAEAWARQWFEQRAEREERSTLPTVAEYLEEWLKRREKSPNVKRTTRSNNRAHVTRHISPKLGANTLRDLCKPRVCVDFVTELCDGGRPAYTIRNIVATLKTALDDAVDERLIPTNPMRSKAVRRVMPKPQTRAGRHVIVHLPKPDAERLLTSGVPGDRRARYLLALLGGLEEGVIAGATWSDVRTEHGVKYLDVTKALDTNYQLTSPKNDFRVRRVPLHPLAVEALEQWKASGFVQLIGRHPRPSDPIFPNDKGKHYRPRSAELLRGDLERASCPTKYAGHDLEFRALRRSFATWLQEAEVPDSIRKRLMGHSAGDVLGSHYTATELRTLQAAILKLSLDLHVGEVVPLRKVVGDDHDRDPDPDDGGGPGGSCTTKTDAVAADFAAAPQQAAATQLAKAPKMLLHSPPEARGTLVRPSVFKTDAAAR